MGLLRKTVLYGTALSLLASCALFSNVPPKVVEGQRIAYQGINLIEDNISTILNAYEKDCKAAVTYHVMFIYEQKIEEIRKDGSLNEHEIGTQIARLTSRRDEEIRTAFVNIEEKRRVMLDMITKNTIATKKLIEAVYSYMSATPITIDNISFLVEIITSASNGATYNGQR